jgi:hypothetical protein
MVPAWLARNRRWKLLMQSLYYPAVLGTCFVLLINKLASHRSVAGAISDVTVYFGLFLTMYFTISYLLTNEVVSDAYSVFAFAVDLLEVVLIFLAFAALGYLEPERPEKVNFRRAYLYLFPVPILQQVWNHCVGYRDKRLWSLSGAASVLSIAGAALGGRWLPFNVCVLAVFCMLLAWYFWMLIGE